MKLMGSEYPELCEEVHKKFRVGMHAMIIKEEDDNLPRLVLNAMDLGYVAGKRDMLAEAIANLHNLDEFKAASGDNESQ